jgi:hypothetical protein
MIQSTEPEWSDLEQKIARSAFDRAYEKEISTLVTVIREQAQAVTSSEDVWYLHDLLSAKRHELDGKYDYRYSELIWVFASLIKDGWIELGDLDGLDPDKLRKIAALTRM